MHPKLRGHQLLLISSLLVSISFFNSCDPQHPFLGKAKPWSDSFSIKATSAFKPIDTNIKVFAPIAEHVRLAYQLGEYQPIWLVEKYLPNSASGKLIEDLEDLQWDGFDTGKYNITFLKNLKTKLDTSHNNSLADAFHFDTLLTHYYLEAAKDLLIGRISPKKADSLWYHSNDSSWDAPKLLASSKNDYPPLDEFRSKVPTYTLLRDEYKRLFALTSDSAVNESFANVAQVTHPDSESLELVNAAIKTKMPWVTPVTNDSISNQAQMIIAYQSYNGLRPTGKLDSATIDNLSLSPDSILGKIALNMERIRWMQKDFGSLYLVVDIPLMELYLRKDGANLMHMRVVVGKNERQTPSLFAKMANIVINPPWGVPPTIMKKEVLPGIEKSGKKYLAKKGFKAYDYKGKIVSPGSINKHNYNNYIYQQPPGDDNALGYVKFNLPNKWDIYLHDTPHRGDFGRRDRALSSGCIRLNKPQEMAVFILSQLEKINFTQGKLDTMIKTHRTRYEVLKNKIPVHITYLTAFEDSTGQHLQFLRDVYHRDEKLLTLLNSK